MAKPPSKGLYTMLGEGTMFDGTLTVPHSIHIDGRVKGTLDITDDLMVGPNGIIEARITARNAVIAGKIIGDLTVAERVELQSSSSLQGNLQARDLVIEEGAHFQGNCLMPQTKNPKA